MRRLKPWTARQERMFVRADVIKHQHQPGHWLPIVRSLAVQGVPAAQFDLGDIYSDERWSGEYCPQRALLWYRRAILRGHPTAMYNLAITYRNWGDMARYRYWLARSARYDAEVRAELKAFRSRFPHEVMRRWRRYAKER
jgi:TPR repeat protein